MQQGHYAAPGTRARVFVVPARPAIAAIAVSTGAVLAASGMVSVLRLVSGHELLYGFDPLFDLDGESNVPSWFSSVLLLLASLLLAATALAHRGAGAFVWGALAVGLLFLSVDETAQIHERIAQQTLSHLSLFPRPTFHWVLFGAPIAAAAGLALLPFIRRLPRRTAWGFTLAGVTFAGASIGLETLTGLLRGGGLSPGTAGYYALVFCEEAGEMAAVVILIGTLLLYWRDDIGEVNIRVR